MRLPLSAFIAYRFVRAKQRNRFISFISASSTIGITLGVAVLIIILSAMNGFETQLRERLLAVIPHVEFSMVSEPISDWQQLAIDAQQHPRVKGVAPFIRFSAMLERGRSLKPLEVRGVDPNWESRVSAWTEYVTPSTASRFNAPYQLLLGRLLADDLGLTVGDRVLMMVPQLDRNNDKLRAPKRQVFTLTGIVDTGGQYDAQIGYISMADAQKLTGIEEGVQGLRLKLADVMLAPMIAREVGYGLTHHLYIRDWTRSHGHLYNDIQLVRSIVYLVLALVVGVASFNIVSTLVMAVRDKQGEIAILKTMGAGRRLIIGVFVFQGALTGISGALFGSVLGCVVAKNLSAIAAWIEQLMGRKLLDETVYFIDFIPSELHQQDVVLAVVLAIATSLLATLYPAWRAAKIEPASVVGQLG